MSNDQRHRELFVCGDGEEPTCDHRWDGPTWESEDGRTESATCSKCDAIAIHLDLMRLP